MINQQQKPAGSSFREFLWRVFAVHIITYFLAGGLAYTIFSYDKLYATGTDNDNVEFAFGNWIGHERVWIESVSTSALQSRQSTWIAQPAQPTSQAIENTCSSRRAETDCT